jgi:hypothetical protein
MQLMLKQQVKCMKKNICQFVMAEWDRLVELCSNDLPVFVLEKQIEGAYGLCFCCADLPSMEIIHLPCCKASVHRHCVLDSLTTNDQCVYCRQYLDPQDILDCTPIRMACSGDASNTTRSQVNAAQESIMSGVGGPVGPLTPIFFSLKILLSQTFKNSGGVTVRRHFSNLASPIFDFAPPPQRHCNHHRFADPCGRIFTPLQDGSANYRNVRTSRIPWVMFQHCPMFC